MTLWRYVRTSLGDAGIAGVVALLVSPPLASGG